jgi:hypothetical protein
MSYSETLTSRPLPIAAPLTGSHLTFLLKDTTAKQRAEIATQLVTGELRPVWLTEAQVARLVGTAAWCVHEALEFSTVAPLPVHSVAP